MVQSSKRPGQGHVRLPASDRVYYAVTGVILTVLFLLVLYPLVYILSASFSSPAAVSTGKVVLWPVDVSLRGYRAVFEYKTVGIGYRNTAFYTVAGTFINVVMTMICAYPLARKTLPGRSWLMLLFSFTMIFSGGMIPTYILMQRLSLLNTVWVMILPGAISVTNMIIARTFIVGIPSDLLEASQIDGCSDFMYFLKVVLPLSKAVLAVIALYYAVGHWNAYFNAFLYLTNQKLFPLQLFLREVLVMNQVDPQMLIDPEMQEAMQGMQDLLKYSLIVVATVPILCVYPFAQRYFVQGVMIGSLKG
ncbi:MAG TPA: carbohydrate ABC transporter permease [Clostridia bacterium]|nr:carbohydrate ABC transporter permease [Clostridia bacterium]